MSGANAGPSCKPKVESSKPSDTSLKRKRGMFQKDLQHMMYGYGDDQNPLPETMALVEDIVVEYVTDIVHKAQEIASKRGRLLTEDFLFLMRKYAPESLISVSVENQPQPHVKNLALVLLHYVFCVKDLPKLNRCTELLAMNEELKQARKAFEVDEEKIATTID